MVCCIPSICNDDIKKLNESDFVLVRPNNFSYEMSIIKRPIMISPPRGIFKFLFWSTINPKPRSPPEPSVWQEQLCILNGIISISLFLLKKWLKSDPDLEHKITLSRNARETGQNTFKLIDQVPKKLCGLIHVAGSRGFLINSTMELLLGAFWTVSAARSRNWTPNYGREVKRWFLSWCRAADQHLLHSNKRNGLLHLCL